MKKFADFATAFFLAAIAAPLFPPLTPTDKLPLRDAPAERIQEALNELKALAPGDAVESPTARSIGRAVSSQYERWYPDYSMKEAPAPQPEALRPWMGEEQIPVKGRKLILSDKFLVPRSKAGEVEQVIHEIEAASSFSDAIALLRRYLQDIGVIQHFKTLQLVHGSRAAPEIVLREGLLSSEEIKARGLMEEGTYGRDAEGPGVYFTGPINAGWERNEYGKRIYAVKLTDIDLIFYNGGIFEEFFYLEAAIRQFWGKEAPLDHVEALPDYFFTDLQIDGLAHPILILIKRRVIDPQYISVLR